MSLKILQGAVAMAAALLCPGAMTAPPPIDPASLQPYSGGSATIAGTAFAFTGGSVVCAPDIPYVEWYVKQLPDRAADYNWRVLKDYTRLTPVNGGKFKCGNLRSGSYLVWALKPQNTEQFDAFSSPNAESRTSEVRPNAANRSMIDSGSPVHAIPSAPWESDANSGVTFLYSKPYRVTLSQDVATLAL